MVKTIRNVDGVGGPSDDASGMFVLHLVRDPRPVVRSEREHLVRAVHRFSENMNHTSDDEDNELDVVRAVGQG